jgi:hypothetical protein
MAKTVGPSLDNYKRQFPKGTKVGFITGGPTMAVDGYFEPIEVAGFRDADDAHKIICHWFSRTTLKGLSIN